MPELLKTHKLPFYLLLDELSFLAFLFPIAFDSIFDKKRFSVVLKWSIDVKWAKALLFLKT